MRDAASPVRAVGVNMHGGFPADAEGNTVRSGQAKVRVHTRHDITTGIKLARVIASDS